MSKTKKYVTAATTFSVALGIGFAMQYGDAVASRWGADRPVTGPETQAADPEMVVVPVSASVAVPTTFSLPDAAALPVATPASATVVPTEMAAPQFQVPQADDVLPEPEVILAAVETEPEIEIIPEDPVTLVEDCKISMTATPADMAMVTLALESPCRPDTVVAIHHQGVMFNAVTDEAGALSIDVPALHAEAFFIAAFDDGEGAVAVTGVPEMSMYDRAVLQWQGEADVQLHALEFGADYGDVGHVWAATAGDTARITAGEGGFLTRLGNDALSNALMAEIYTFPSGMIAQDGAVALSVEAEVTARNCGREVAAQTLQFGPDREPQTLDLAMTLPDCDAIGEFLVLKNMFEDLTLAAK